MRSLGQLNTCSLWNYHLLYRRNLICLLEKEDFQTRCLWITTFVLNLVDLQKNRVLISPFLYFSLSGLGLTCIPAELLRPLPNLEEVDLSKNKLTAIVQVGALPQVKVMSFANNQLSNVDGLKAFPNLESLDVTNNPTLEVTRAKLISHLPGKTG